MFVLANGFTSSRLRGENLADAMGVPYRMNSIGDARGDTLVFVKDASSALVEQAKERGCRIVYDPLDQYCYENRGIGFGPLVDVVIVHSHAAAQFYAPVCPKAHFAIIPHQWDARLDGKCAPVERLRAGYIGMSFNCPPEWDGARATATERQIDAAAHYNLHLSANQRDAKTKLLKPATKIVTAAGVRANVVAYDDPSAVELLGDTYPYLIRQDGLLGAVKRARADFGGPVWRAALEIMEAVRARTSLAAIAALYRRLDRGDEQMLFSATANRIAA